MRILVHDKGINEYAPVRKAYDRAKEILGSENPDAKELSNIVKQLDSHPEAVDWLKLEEEGRFEEVYAGIYKLVNPQSEVEFFQGFNGKDVAMVEGNWHECVSKLKVNNLEILTMRQIAELRMKHGKESIYCTKSCQSGEGAVYMPNGDLFIVPKSMNMLLSYSQEATEAHRAGKEFCLMGMYKLLEPTLKISSKKGKITNDGGILYLPRNQVIPDEINVNEFGNNPLTQFLFGDLASVYGDFLKNSGIKLFYVGSIKYYNLHYDGLSREHITSQEEAFSRSLRNGCIYEPGYAHSHEISFSSKLKLSSSDGCAFGMRRDSARGPVPSP